jgi:hypothetical protein
MNTYTSTKVLSGEFYSIKGMDKFLKYKCNLEKKKFDFTFILSFFSKVLLSKNEKSFIILN